MRAALLLAAVTLGVISGTAQSGQIEVIPRPGNMSPLQGHFTIDRRTVIVAKESVERRSAEILAERLRGVGRRLKIVSRPPAANYIEILPPSLALQHMGGLTTSTYAMHVDHVRVRIEGFEQGQFYALNSLMQLLPVTIRDSAKIPAVLIIDQPRFPYRGMHLDVGRHFMPVEFVKKYIDLMSQYKFNYFHWGLTQDQGWRVEIKKYPRLTEIGSKRSESHEGVYSTTFKGDRRPVEGFYTQEQIKDVIAYAKARYITVIPEINVPGHSSAALAAYPQFGCKQNYEYRVQQTWGIFKEVYCPTEETFKFLEDVFAELIELFKDSPYIHIGGDEVLKDHWKESAFVQELKKRENLKDEHEVQSYFVRRIEKFINSKGKKMVGWDEILEGGLAPNATVMSWRGMKGGIEAARAKHDVIMTPTDHVYFDYGQGDPAYEPLNIGSYLPLEKVYAFEPVPKELNADEAKYVIGGQANVWTEYLETPAAVEYMAFPRMLALSEVLWSRPDDKNYSDFLRRLNANLARLDAQNVNYRIPEPRGLKNMVVGDSGTARVILTPAAGTRVFYTLDGSTPDERSMRYTKPIAVALSDGEVRTLKTVVTNAAGRKSVVYAGTLVRAAPNEGMTLQTMTPGVKYEFVLPDDESERKTESDLGSTRSILLTQFAKKYDLKKPFIVSFDGYVKAEKDEVYEFWVDATWDVGLAIDGKQIIEAAGTKDRKIRSAVVALKAGWHQISLRYNHRGGDAHFRVRYGIKGQGLRQIYGGELVH